MHSTPGVPGQWRGRDRPDARPPPDEESRPAGAALREAVVRPAGYWFRNQRRSGLCRVKRTALLRARPSAVVLSPTGRKGP